MTIVAPFTSPVAFLLTSTFRPNMSACKSNPILHKSAARYTPEFWNHICSTLTLTNHIYPMQGSLFPSGNNPVITTLQYLPPSKALAAPTSRELSPLPLAKSNNRRLIYLPSQVPTTTPTFEQTKMKPQSVET